MNLDIRQFEKRILNSQIIDKSAWSTLIQKFESESNGENPDSENLAHWLCQQKVISSFQADILLNEHEPRLQYGNYRLVNRLDENNECYSGFHRSTSHPVALRFYSGDDANAIQKWQNAKSQVSKLAAAKHPCLGYLFETVSIPEYRFVVSEKPIGKRLDELVPEKTRIAIEKANRIVFQIASALKHLSENDLQVDLNIDTAVWAQKNGHVKLFVPLEESVDAAMPMPQQLGLTWYRIASGRQPKFDSQDSIPKAEWLRLKKFNVDTDTIRIIRGLIVGERTADPFKAVLEHLKDLEAKLMLHEPNEITSLQSYLSWLTAAPGIQSEELPLVESTFVLESGESNTTVSDVDVDIRNEITGQFQKTEQRKSRKLLMPLIGSMLALVAIVAAIIGLTLNLPNEFGPKVADSTDSESVKTVDSEDSIPAGPVEPESPIASQPMRESYVNQVLVQDDQNSLWESPTTGPPVDFTLVPTAPKILASIRFSELMLSPDGEKFLKSMVGPLESELQTLESLIGLQRNDIGRLTISFHSNADFEYDVFYIVNLAVAVSQTDLLAGWGEAERRSIEDETYFFKSPTECFATFSDTEQMVQQFVFGPQSLVEECVLFKEVATVSGIMKRLSSNSDRDRHFTLLALRSGLFGDEGQKLMGQENLDFNRLLSSSISNVVRGIAASVHIDNGTYVQFHLDQSVDMTPQQIANRFSTTLQGWETSLAIYAESMVPNPYWDAIRTRIGEALSDFTTHFRFGVEDRQVIGNGWFPISAAHNWFVASDLLLTFGPSQYVAASEEGQRKTVPQSLEELLATPRDLSVSTSPDLILLMNNLQLEINDEYGSLPFEFKIKLMGSDLSKEGITQNQRPSDFQMRQKPLADILTEIMVKANPNKNITGPDDVECKMVWVAAADPENPEQEIILITTRAAATTNSYELPAAFQPSQ